MKSSRMLVLVVAWAASLLGVGLWAQAGTGWKEAPVIQMGQPHGDIITGADIGFQRIAAPAERDGKIAGRLMVRINGQWSEVTFPARLVR